MNTAFNEFLIISNKYFGFLLTYHGFSKQRIKESTDNETTDKDRCVFTPFYACEGGLFMLDIYTLFFYKQQFYKQRQSKIGKKLNKS